MSNDTPESDFQQGETAALYVECHDSRLDFLFCLDDMSRKSDKILKKMMIIKSHKALGGY